MDNTKLYSQIIRLPQVLQDLIGEYNVHHRKQIERINEEYFSIIYKNCKICNSSFTKEIFCSVDYFINITYNLECYWCSDICFTNDKNEKSKKLYLDNLNDYLLNKTFQFPRNHLEL